MSEESKPIQSLEDNQSKSTMVDGVDVSSLMLKSDASDEVTSNRFWQTFVWIGLLRIRSSESILNFRQDLE